MNLKEISEKILRICDNQTYNLLFLSLWHFIHFTFVCSSQNAWRYIEFSRLLELKSNFRFQIEFLK